MLKREIQHPGKIASTGAYSAAVEVDGCLYISGQGPVDMKTGEIVRGSIEEETRLTLSHIAALLEAAGYTREHVVKCTCHLADIVDFEKLDRVYGEFFHGVRPARTTVQSGLGAIKVEIDAVARKS